MKKFTPALLCLVLFVGTIQAQTFKIVGYMPSWAGSSTSIQYDKLTHIVYSFVEPNTNGSGALLAMPNITKVQDIITRAHAVNVKVFLAIGGWGDGNDSEWATLASSSTSRTTFRNQAMAYVWQYGFDGIDMDWEYPSNDAEATDFVRLMTILSDTLHKSGKKLSAAVYAGSGTGSYIYDEVFDLVDWLNIMAYDNCCSGSHSSYGFAVNSLDYWIARGLPASKAILGVPFYGRSSNGASYTSYRSLITINTANSQVDSYVNGSGVTIWYNGIQTIKDKSIYAKNNGGGIMIWELSQDATGAYSLLSAINEVQPAIPTSVNSASTFNTEVSPVPAVDFLQLKSELSDLEYEVTSISGQVLLSGQIAGSGGNINVSTLPQGFYIVQLRSSDRISIVKFLKN